MAIKPLVKFNATGNEMRAS